MILQVLSAISLAPVNTNSEFIEEPISTPARTFYSLNDMN